MHALIWRALNSRLPHMFVYHTKCSFCKIRKYSQKVNTPINLNDTSQEEKRKKYIHKIPPWMRRNRLENEQVDEIKQECKAESEETTAPALIKQQVFQNKTLSSLGNTIKKQFLNTSTTVETNRSTIDRAMSDDRKSVKSRFLQPIPRKVPEDCMSLSKEKEVKRQVIPSFEFRKSKDPCGNKKPKEDSCVPSSDKMHEQEAKSEAEETRLQPEQTEAIRTASFTNINDKVATESSEKRKTSRTTSQSLKSKTSSTDYMNTPSRIDNLASQESTKTYNRNQTTGIKVNELLMNDILWAQEKINEMKMQEEGPAYLNKDKNKNLARQTETPQSQQAPTMSFAERKKLSEIKKSKEIQMLKNKFMENKDKVVLNVTSNPLKLNSKETLYANSESNTATNNKIANEQQLKVKNENQTRMTAESERNNQAKAQTLHERNNQAKAQTSHERNNQAKAQTSHERNNQAKAQTSHERNNEAKAQTSHERNVINMRKRIKSKSKVKTKLSYLDIDDYVNSTKNAQLITYSKATDARGKRMSSGKIKKYINELKAVPPKRKTKNLNEPIHRSKSTTRKNSIFQFNNTTKELNKINPNTIRKQMSSNVGGYESYHRSTSLDALNKDDWQMNANRRNISSKQFWNKDVEKNPKLRLQQKANTLLSNSKRSHAYVPSKPVLKRFPIRQASDISTMSMKKKSRPVFGPPCGDDNGGDETAGPLSAYYSCDIQQQADHLKDRYLTSENRSKELAVKEQDECSVVKDNKQLSMKIKRFLHNYLNIMFDIYKQMVRAVVKRNNQPKDNLNVSLLVTQRKKQPIYICDTCSYLTKCPTIYQRLKAKIENFPHLIKTRDTRSKRSENAIESFAQMDLMENKESDENQQKQSKTEETADKTKVLLSCNQRQSYSDVLSNLFTSHVQQRSSSSKF